MLPFDPSSLSASDWPDSDCEPDRCLILLDLRGVDGVLKICFIKKSFQNQFQNLIQNYLSLARLGFFFFVSFSWTSDASLGGVVDAGGCDDDV